MSVNVLCSALQSYISHSSKKEHPERERGNPCISDSGEYGMSELRVGGMVNIVRWCKEVKRNGTFESAFC